MRKVFATYLTVLCLEGSSNVGVFKVFARRSRAHHASHTHCDVEPCVEATLEYRESADVAIPNKCPAGYDFDGWQCIEKIRFSAEFKCKSGHRHSAGKCIEYQHVEPVLSCDEGTLLGRSSKCEIYEEEQAEVRCSHGFSWDERGGKCVKHVYQKPLLSCPDGYALRDKYCVRRQALYEKPTCKEPFEAMEGPSGKIQCLQKLICDKAPQCPRGFTLVDGVCRGSKTVRPERICEDGHHFYRGSCHQDADTREATKECRFGVLDEALNACVEEITQEPGMRCSHGYELINGMCTRRAEEPPETVCPAGFQVAPDPLGLSVDGVKRAICEKRTKHEPEYECPGGGEASHGKCWVVEKVDPVATCKHGMTLDEDGNFCFSEKFYAPDANCPPGTSLEHHMCVEEICQAAEYRCEDPAHVLVGTTCRKTKTYTPEFDCSSPKHRNNPICAGNVAPHLFCDDFMLPRGRGPLDRAPDKTRVFLKDNQCVVEEQIQAEMFCEAGSLIGKKCTSDVDMGPPTPLCPHGTELDNSKRCVRLRRIAAKLECAGNKILNSSGTYCENR